MPDGNFARTVALDEKPDHVAYWQIVLIKSFLRGGQKTSASSGSISKIQLGDIHFSQIFLCDRVRGSGGQLKLKNRICFTVPKKSAPENLDFINTIGTKRTSMATIENDRFHVSYTSGRIISMLREEGE